MKRETGFLLQIFVALFIYAPVAWGQVAFDTNVVGYAQTAGAGDRLDGDACAASDSMAYISERSHALAQPLVNVRIPVASPQFIGARRDQGHDDASR